VARFVLEAKKKQQQQQKKNPQKIKIKKIKYLG